MSAMSQSNDLALLLYEWEAELRNQGFPFDQSTNPGLDPGLVRDRLLASDLRPEPELVTWFSWRDGQRTEAKTPPLTPWFWMARLDWCLDKGNYGLDFGTEIGQWDPNWIMLSSDTARLVLDIGDADRPPITRIVEGATSGLPGAADFTIAESLSTPVRWYIESLRSGGIRWDSIAEEWDRDASRLDPEAMSRMYV